MKCFKYSLLVLLIVSNSDLYIVAQPKVINPKYQKVLDQMLNHTVPEISVSELKNCIEDVLILDSREAEEYNVSHIVGAKFVGYDHFNIENLKNVSKNKKIVCYCSIGYRSEKIALILIHSGYTNVYNLYGSIFEWVNMNYQIVDKHNNLTNKLHPYSLIWGHFIDNPQIIKSYK